MHASAQALDALVDPARARIDGQEAGEVLLAWLRADLPAWNVDLLAGRRPLAEFPRRA